MMRIQRRK